MTYQTTEIKYMGVTLPGNPYPGYGAGCLHYTEQRYTLMPFLYCPKCGKSICLKNHDIEINDGIVAITPSIGHLACGAHFHIRDNKVKILEDL